MTGILLLILIFCISCAFALWRKKNERFNEPPPYPRALPILGHSLSLIGRKNLWNFLREMSINTSRGEGVTSMLIGPTIKMYVVCNPDDCLLISNQCLDKSVYYDYGKSWMGDCLISCKSTVWKKDRKMIMPAFNQQVLVGFLENFNKESRKLVERLSAKSDNGTFDHVQYINRYALDTFCDTVLGIDIMSDKEKYMHMTETLMKILVKRLFNLVLHSDTVYKWTGLKNIEENYTKFFHKVSDDMIKKKRLEKEKHPHFNTGPKKSFLELMLEISDREAMTDNKIRDQLNLMIVAGFTTVSVTMAIILVMIGSHEDVQDKIYTEINEVFSGSPRDVEQKDLDRLVYLEAVIKETLRLCPTGPMIIRELTEDVKLENYTLYAGNSCMLLLSALSLHPMWGDDVLQFKPERWLDPRTLPDHPAAFAAFSIGRRNCIGKYYAMIYMKTFLVHVIRNYVIAADWTKTDFGLHIMTTLVAGHHIGLKARV